MPTNPADAGFVDEATGGHWLQKEEKQELFEQAYPFVIVDAMPKHEGKFEPQTVFVVEFSSDPKKRPGYAANTIVGNWYLPFPHTTHREKRASKMLAFFAANPDESLGPWYVGKYVVDEKRYERTEGSEGFSWDLRTEAPPADERQRFAAKPSRRKVTVPDDDDSIPF